MTECTAILGGHSAMMWTMGAFTLLILAIMLLGAVALVKYLFFGRGTRGGPGNALAAPPSTP